MGRSGQGHGSGFIVGGSGYLLTNQHVVKQAKRVQVIFANGLEAPGEVLRRDAMRDVVSVKSRSVRVASCRYESPNPTTRRSVRDRQPHPWAWRRRLPRELAVRGERIPKPASGIFRPMFRFPAAIVVDRSSMDSAMLSAFPSPLLNIPGHKV